MKLDPAAPARTWNEVLKEYNRRNPDNPIKSRQRLQQLHSSALKKIKAAIKDQADELVGECR